MEAKYCVTTLGELLDELRALDACAEPHLARLESTAGRHATIFYDMHQAFGIRLYPYNEEANVIALDEANVIALERVLGELSLRASTCALAAAAENIMHRETLGRGGEHHATYLDLARDSPAWAAVAARCGEHLELLRVQRVHNPVLQDQYESFKRRMTMKPLFSEVNERVLFHGTARTDPALVCLGTEGLDPRCASHGNYGAGTYFSSTSSYSAKHYAYVPPAPQSQGPDVMGLVYESSEREAQRPRQMLLARVACGNMCDFDKRIDQTLTRPPVMDPVRNVLYDCVVAGPFSSRSSLMHMVTVYDKAQALPEHLVTFRYRSTFEEANRPRPPPQQQQQQQHQQHQQQLRIDPALAVAQFCFPGGGQPYGYQHPVHYATSVAQQAPQHAGYAQFAQQSQPALARDLWGASTAQSAQAAQLAHALPHFLSSGSSGSSTSAATASSSPRPRSRDVPVSPRMQGRRRRRCEAEASREDPLEQYDAAPESARPHSAGSPRVHGTRRPQTMRRAQSTMAALSLAEGEGAPADACEDAERTPKRRLVSRSNSERSPETHDGDAAADMLVRWLNDGLAQ